jgi:hypothetical protein
VYYENLFDLLFRTTINEAGNGFWMTSNKTWGGVTATILRELPALWWRRS